MVSVPTKFSANKIIVKRTNENIKKLQNKNQSNEWEIRKLLQDFCVVEWGYNFAINFHSNVNGHRLPPVCCN